MDPISPSAVRFIKLGPANRWFESSRANNRLEFGHNAVPHDVALAGQWETVKRYYVEKQRRTPGKAADFVRELTEFYTQPETCLWITFAQGRLWWCFATAEVVWLGGEGTASGERASRPLQPWCDRDIHGEILRQNDLSSRLTKVAAYRQTLCTVEADEYVVRRINGIEEPTVARARQAEQALMVATRDMLASLHWQDFEVLVDLIFARSGWQRVSVLGKGQKDIDLEVLQPITRERAFVQVKARSMASVLAEYTKTFEDSGTYEKMFFVCQELRGALPEIDHQLVQVWTGDRLAEEVVRAGLVNWVVDHVS